MADDKDDEELLKELAEALKEAKAIEAVKKAGKDAWGKRNGK
jgi:hypothetical protein